MKLAARVCVGVIVAIVAIILFTNWSGALLSYRPLHGFYRLVLEGRAQRLHEQFRVTCKTAGVSYNSVLDFGCGFGGLGNVLRRNKVDVISVDAVDHYIYTDRDLQIVDKKATRLPFRNFEFDVAVSSYCFHHIPTVDHARLLSELTRTARTVVLIEEHPKRNLLCRFLNSEVFTHANAHMTATKWKQHLDDMGFSIIESVTLGDSEFSFVIRGHPTHPAHPAHPAHPPQHFS